MNSVAILGSCPAALIVARSLASRGLAVDILRHSDRSVADRSRAVRQVYQLGDVRRDVEEHIHLLCAHLTRHSYDLLIPINDVAMSLCLTARDQLEPLVTLAMPESAAVEACQDKDKTLTLAAKVGVPVPSYSLLTTLKDLEAHLSSSPRFPFYAKPVSTVVNVDNKMNMMRGARVEDAEALEALCRATLPREPLMLQELIGGTGVGVHLLAEKGRIVAWVQQHRLHEPIGGGAGSYRISALVSPPLSNYTCRLIEALNYTGVAMVEFRGDSSSGNFALMEINGRFWGSLALTLSAGLDMPFWLYQLHCEPGGLKAFHSVAPRVGVRQRKLSTDLEWLYVQLRRERAKAVTLATYLADLKYLVKGQEHLDLEDLADPLPALEDFRNLTSHALSPLTRRLSTRLASIRYARQEPALLQEAMDRLRRPDVHLLFVCLGNICRSPFAEFTLRQKYGVKEVASAGTLLMERRMSPRSLEELAFAEFGVDLTLHRSKSLTRALYEWADIVFVMDLSNLDALSSQGYTGKPALLLGSLDGSGSVGDPYQRDVKQTRLILERMTHLLERLMGMHPLGLGPLPMTSSPAT